MKTSIEDRPKYNEDECPICLSDNVYWEDYNITTTNSEVVFVVWCTDCGANWQQVYKYVDSDSIYDSSGKPWPHKK